MLLSFKLSSSKPRYLGVTFASVNRRALTSSILKESRISSLMSLLINKHPKIVHQKCKSLERYFICMYMTRFVLFEAMLNSHLEYIAYLNKSVLLRTDIYRKTKHTRSLMNPQQSMTNLSHMSRLYFHFRHIFTLRV
jgi:hypothetical protein